MISTVAKSIVIPVRADNTLVEAIDKLRKEATGRVGARSNRNAVIIDLLTFAVSKEGQRAWRLVQKAKEVDR